MRLDRRLAASHRRIAAAALVALGVGGGCDSPTVPGEAPAYDPTSLTAGRVYRWPLGAIVRVHVAAPGGAPSLLPLARDAAAAWLATLRYREIGVRFVDSLAEADVVVAYADAHPVALDACGAFDIGAAFTLLCPASDSARTLPLRDGSVSRVKLAIAIDAELVVSEVQRRALVAHELGHALGIGGHSAEPGDVMHADPTSAVPSGRDARTLRYVVHRPVAIRLR